MILSKAWILSLKTPHRVLPIITHAVELYKLWHSYRNDLPLAVRRSLGDKIDVVFVQILEYLFVASYQNREEKLPTIILVIRKTDLLKFFLQILWELRSLDNKRYIAISEKAGEIGRMVGGWKKDLETKNPPARTRG
ncbi:MAG: four helix bundle protein [Patescibacteria group bacterium]